jgi:hypothetical protein
MDAAKGLKIGAIPLPISIGIGLGLEWLIRFAADRIPYPPALRNRSSTRKEAYEKAKRAGGGQEPRHDPNGHGDDRRPHFHPDVPNAQRQTPHQPSFHDHYYYPKLIWGLLQNKLKK